MRARSRPAPRSGVAAIELGFVAMMFMVPLIIATWEVGRLIHVQQIVTNAAREGARLAGQGFTIKSDGTQVQIQASSGSPNVTGTVVEYLRAAGLNVTSDDVTVTFAFTPAAGFDSTLTDPYQGLKGQPFTVYVSVPWERVRWINLGLIRPSDVHFTASWRMLVDDAFTVNETIPTW